MDDIFKRFVKIFICFVLVCPLRIYAFENDNSYSIINDNKSLESDGLTYDEFSNLNSLVPSESNAYKYYDYVIDKYDVDIIVNENNTFDVTETIEAYFNVPKHGIFRTIPLRNTVTRLDGTTSTNRAQVTDVSVDNEYTTSRENGNYKLKIGSANHVLTGKQTYVIKYKYNLGKDPLKDYDELYYDIIGSEWDTVIGNISFSIKMPKEFDSSKLGFSSGTVGSTDSKVSYSVDGEDIIGRYIGILGAGEALTVRCELPQGYFVGDGLTSNKLALMMLIVPILGFISSFVLWYKFGRDDIVIETTEFYPPEGLNSLEVGYLHKGCADNKDIVSLLIYLANKGYIKITEIEEKELFLKRKGYKITKLKEYDGNNTNEQLFLNGLFLKKAYTINKSKISNDDICEVTLRDLYNNFYITMGKISRDINGKKNKDNVFVNNSLKKVFIVVLMVISLGVLAFFPAMECGGMPDFILIIFLGVFFMQFFGIFLKYEIPLTTKVVLFVFIICFFFPLFIGFSKFSILDVVVSDIIYLLSFVIGILCLIGMRILYELMTKRTKYGNEMLGKIRGFKRFLETAEKEKLEALVMENPTYFYDILPYTYVLGVSDKWIKRFESISLQSPSWYDSPNVFNMSDFGNFMSSTMSTANSSMSSSPSSGSYGGSSGGGSSGGGSGGGGGGSW